MKFFWLVLLILFIASCTEKTIEIKTSYAEKAGIRTTRIEVHEDAKEIPKPQIDIISPKNGEVLKDNKLVVKLNVSNFKLVNPDRYPQKGQGHVQVWIDDMEFRGSKTEFVFENESNGTHRIKAELMLSNNTVLPYSKTIKIIVNKRDPKVKDI